MESDYSILESISQEYMRLKLHNPDHYLLSYAEITGTSGAPIDFIKGDKYSRFLTTFGNSSSEESALRGYFTALTNAIDGIEGIVRSEEEIAGFPV